MGCGGNFNGGVSEGAGGRTVEGLLCTPLSAWDIVWGKFLGSARRAAFGLLLIVGHLVVSGLLSTTLSPFVRVLDGFFPTWWGSRNIRPDSLHPVALILVPMILGGPMAFLLATGIFLSARFKKSTSATVCNMGLAIGLWAVLPMTAFMLTEGLLSYDNGLTYLFQNGAVVINPTPMATIAVDGSMNDSSVFDYDMPRGNWGLAYFLLAHAAVCVAYLGAAWLALRGAAATLAGPTGRMR